MSVFINGRFVKNEDALLHVSDLSMQRGYAVFDFFRTVNGIPLFPDDHLDRFYSSANALHLPVRKSREEIKMIAEELIRSSGLKEAGIRIMLTGGLSADTYHPSEPSLVITCNPVQTANEQDFEKGIRIISHEYQRELPHIKSINYMQAVWLLPLLERKKADDVIYHLNGVVTEFPRSNIFIVTKNGMLVTPEKNVLAGITRKQVLMLANEMMPVEVRDLMTAELKEAAEIFLTSTSKKIMPVLALDDILVADGKPGLVTRSLYHRFTALEKTSLTW